MARLKLAARQYSSGRMTSDRSASFQFIHSSAIATPTTSNTRLKIISMPRPVKFLSCSTSDIERVSRSPVWAWSWKLNDSCWMWAYSARRSW